MGDRWDYVNIFHPNQNILNNALSLLESELNDVMIDNPLSDHYINREYYDRFHLRIGFKKPYSKEKIKEIISRVEDPIYSSTKEKIKSSEERDDVEDLKGLAKDIIRTPSDSLGRIDKLAHIIHYYLNESQIRFGDGIREGRESFNRNQEIYDRTKIYLHDAITILAMLYSEWNRIHER